MGLRATDRESHDGEELPDATFWPEVALTALQPSTLLFAKAISTSYGILEEPRQEEVRPRTPNYLCFSAVEPRQSPPPSSPHSGDAHTNTSTHAPSPVFVVQLTDVPLLVCVRTRAKMAATPARGKSAPAFNRNEAADFLGLRWQAAQSRE